MKLRPQTMWICVGFALVAFAFVGCSDDEDTTAPPVPVDEFALLAEYGDTYLATYKRPDGGPVNVAAKDVYTTMTDMDQTNDYYIIDWRGKAHYDAGHIEGARNLSLGALMDELPTLPTDRVILNVCYSGQTASTATVILNLLGQEMGFNAVNLKFGMHGWTYQGNTALGIGTYPMEDDWVNDLETTVNAKAVAGDFPTIDTGERDGLEILKARATAFLAAGWKKISDDDLRAQILDFYIINYFPQSNYEAGHLPGAVRYQNTSSSLESDLLTTTFLNTLPTDKKILVYCWTGQTSAQMAAYLNLLGYEAYSLLYGVQDLCYNEVEINDHAFVPIVNEADAYPVVQ